MKGLCVKCQCKHTGRKSIALPVLSLGAKREWVFSAMTQLLYPWERDPLPIVQEGWWAWGLVWWGTGNLTPLPEFKPQAVQSIV